MAKPYLIRRGAAYSLRVRTSSDLVGRIGRSEIVRALGTSCPRIARCTAAMAYARLHEAWYRIRIMPDEEASPEKVIEILERTVALGEEVAGLERRKAELTAELSERRHLAERLQRGTDTSQAIKGMAAKAAQLGLEIEQVMGQVEQERAAGRLSRDNLDTLHELLDRSGAVVRGRPAPTVLAFLEDTYIDDKLLSEDHRRHVQGYVRLFAKVLGDRPLNTFRREDVLRWVRTLEKVRTSYGKGGKDHAKPIEAIKRESRGKPTLGVTTIEKHVTHVRGFFTAAIRHHRFATSDDVEAMFGDVRLGKGVPPAKERGIWSLDALNALLGSPLWQGTHARAEEWGRRHQPGPFVHLDAYWWLPVLGLHTGARLEELAQLQHADLLEDTDGRPFLHLNNEGDRRLKNARSVRAVPLHPFLVGLGFPALFRPGTKGRIFPELRAAGRPLKWGGQYSEDFTAYRRKVGVYAPLVDFHAFRHTVVTALREAGADAALVGQMVGHQDDGELKRFVQTNRYTHFSVRARADAMARLDWEAQGLDLSHLRRAVRAAGGPRGHVRATDLDARPERS